MNLIRNAACAMLLVSVPLAAVGSQKITEKKLSADPQAKPAAEQKRSSEPSESKFLSVLNQMLELQKSFPDENTRIGIQAEIGDLLWSYDEPRGRALLEEAFHAIANVKVTDPRRAAWSMAASRRLWVLRMIARHDSALALKLQQSIEIPSNTDQTSFSGENAMYAATLSVLLAAGQNQEIDISRLTQAVKPFAERGDLNRFIPFLRQIRSKDAKVADELFVQALEKAKQAPPGFDELRWLAWYLFPGFGDGVISFSSSQVERDPYEAIQISPEVLRQFFDLAYDVAARGLEVSFDGADKRRSDLRSYLDYGIQKLLVPYFDRFMPDRAAAFRARVDEVRRRFSQADPAALVMREPGTVQELLQRAETLIDTRQKDGLYVRAAEQACAARNYDQAATITEKINDEPLRSRQKEMVRERADNDRLDEIRKAIQDRDVDRAEQMILRMSDRNFRMWMFQSLISVTSEKDKGRALEMLAEANRRAANTENGVERSLELISLAHAAGGIDTNRGFEEMKLAIAEFNRAGIAPEWEKYEEIETTSGGGEGKTTRRVNVGAGILSGHPDLQWLGNMDFDRGLALAQQVQVREASALAQLAVCRGALTKLRAYSSRKSIATEKPSEPNRVKQL